MKVPRWLEVLRFHSHLPQVDDGCVDLSESLGVPSGTFECWLPPLRARLIWGSRVMGRTLHET